MSGTHADVTAAGCHVVGYVQASDPGAIGAGKVWIDTSGGTGSWALKVRNAANDGWETVGSGGGVGYVEYAGPPSVYENIEAALGTAADAGDAAFYVWYDTVGYVSYLVWAAADIWRYVPEVT